MGFCEGCGQPALSATREGRPICPDCIEEGYGDENTDPDMATIAYFAGAKDARGKIAALQAHADAMAKELGRSCDGWGNVVELGLVPPQHMHTAIVLANSADETLRAYEAFKAEECE